MPGLEVINSLAGKAATDDMKIGSLGLKENFKLMMMGSLEETIIESQTKPENLPEVINDLDIEEEEVALQDREFNLEKIEKRVRDYEVKVVNPSREGKKLLVLDIDYTLFDHRSVAEAGWELMRPFLHEFLETAYQVLWLPLKNGFYISHLWRLTFLKVNGILSQKCNVPFIIWKKIATAHLDSPLTPL